MRERGLARRSDMHRVSMKLRYNGRLGSASRFLEGASRLSLAARENTHVSRLSRERRYVSEIISIMQRRDPLKVQ